MKSNNLMILPIIILSVFLFGPIPANSQSKTDEEIKVLKEEVRRLKQRVEELETERAEEKKMAEETKRQQEETTEQVSSIGSYIDQRIEKFSLFNTSKFLFSGYGSVGFNKIDGKASSFSAKFAPIFHYQLIDTLHVIIEPEIELEDDEVDIGLEIGQVDWFLNDYLTLSGGKMLLPFNAFSQRFHPTWINKMPNLPLIYSHGGHGHDEEGPSQGIVPILSDVGAQLSGGIALDMFEGSKINYAFYLVNGPRIHVEDEDHAENGDEHMDEEADDHDEEENGEQTELIFGNNFTDVNSNKAFGGRIGFLPVWTGKSAAPSCSAMPRIMWISSCTASIPNFNTADFCS